MIIEFTVYVIVVGLGFVLGLLSFRPFYRKYIKQNREQYND